MRKWIMAAGLLVAVSACGSDEDAASTTAVTTTTISKWRYADQAQGTLRANQPLATPEEISRAADERELADWVTTCTENVPKLAAIGSAEALWIWNGVNQNAEQLGEECLTIAREDPDTRKAIEQSIKKSRRRLRDVDLSATTTTTIDPNKAYIRITCPPNETEAVGSFRAEFAVEQSSPTEVREWGIDYGDGRSYKAGSQATAEEELYWHNYYETGSFEVKVWIVDVDDVRTEATCTVNWSN